MTEKDPLHLPESPLTNDTLTEYGCKAFFEWDRMHMILWHVLNWPINSDSEIKFDPFVIDYVKVYRPEGFKPYNHREFKSYKSYYLFLKDIYDPAHAPFSIKTTWTKHDRKSSPIKKIPNP